jgi:hypothetical protein
MPEKHSIPADVAPSKVCPRCNAEKPATGFRFDSRTRSGLKSWCKECERAHSKEVGQRPEVKAARAAKMREYRQRPEAKAGIRSTQRKGYLRVKGTEGYKARLKVRMKRYKEKTPRHIFMVTLKHALRRRETVNPVTPDELVEMWRRQGGRCAVSGVVLTWASGRILPTSISIDRLDADRGYEKDNVRLVCYQVNTFRGRWSDEQMLAMARAIVANLEPAEPVPGLLSLVA